MEYILVFAAGLMFATAEQIRIRLREKRLLLFALVVVMALFAGLRYGVLADYFNYVRLFEHINDTVNSIRESFAYWFVHSKVEPLSVWIIKIGVVLGSVYFVFLLFATTTLYFWWLGAIRFTPYPILATTVYLSNYFLTLPMTQIRSGLATALLVFAASRMVDNRRSFIATGAALLTHFSSFVFLVVYLVKTVQVTPRIAFFVLVCAAIFGYSGLAGTIVLRVYDLLGQPSQLHSYIAGHRAHRMEAIDLQMIKSVAVLVVAFWARPYIKWDATVINFLISMLVIGLSVRLALVDYQTLGGRLSAYFMIFDAFMLSAMITAFRPRVLAFFAVVGLAAAQFLLNYEKRGLGNGYDIWLFVAH